MIAKLRTLLSEGSPAAAVVQTFGFRILLLFMNLATGVIVARALAPQGRGEQAAMSLWALLVAGVTTFGLPSALSYYARRDPALGDRLLFAGTLFALIAGTIAAGISVGLVPLWLRGYSPATVAEAQWLMIFTPQVLLLAVLRGFLQAKGQFVRYNLTLIYPSAMTIAALIALAVLHRLTPATAPWAYYVPGALWTAWVLVALRGHFVVDLRTLIDDSKVLLSYGLRAFGFDVILTLSTQIDQALIIGFLTPQALGLYTVALTASRVILLVQQSIGIVLSPHAAGLEENEAIALVARSARLTTIAAGIFALLLLIALPLLLPLVYGRAFAPAVPIAMVLTVEAAIAAVGGVLMQAFGATGRPFISTLVQGIWLAGTVALLIVLVPRLGLTGAAVALLSSTILRLAVVLAAYPIALKVPIPRIVPDRADVRYLAGRLVAAGAHRRSG